MRGLAFLALAACGYRTGVAGPDLAPDATADSGPPADWWDPAFHWRMRITIANGSTSPLDMGFQAGLVLALDAAPCSGPRDAIRIIHAGAELDRVIDELSPQWTWFAIAAAIPAGASSGDYFLYCGNLSPTAAKHDPQQVFAFYDDFPGTSLSSLWQTQNDVTVTGGAAQVGGVGKLDSGLLTSRTWTPGHAVDYIAQVATPAAADFWAGFQSGFPDQPPWIQWWSQSPPAMRPDYAYTPTDPNEFLGNNVTLDTAPHLFGVEYYGAASAYRHDGPIVEHHVHAQAATPPALNFRLHNHSSSNLVRYSLARVRLAVDPPPSVTAGAPETY